MKKSFLVFLLCILAHAMWAQRISRNYHERSIADILIDLNKASNRYKITFIYNELEDFTTSRHLENRTIPDAIADCIGFFPIRMEVYDSLITVECTQKGDQRIIGRVVDRKNEPVAYASVALLSPADSSLINGGISNENGRFVIPCDNPEVILRVSFVGYKTYYCRLHNYRPGTIHLDNDRYVIKGVEVKGHKTIVKSDADRLKYLVKNDEFAKGLNGLELMRRVPLIRVQDEDATIIGKENTHFLLDGHEIPEQMIQPKLRSLKAEDIDQIEVITIPPSKYKAEANAGYINIVTRRDKTLGVNGNVFSAFRMREGASPSAQVAPTLNYVDKKIEASGTIDFDHTNSINDRHAVCNFNDGHTKVSDTKNDFIWNWWSINGLVKYRPTKRIEIGATISALIPHTKTWMDDMTTEYGNTDHTRSDAPQDHSRQLSAEAYAEMTLDTLGRKMQLTYDHLHNDEDMTRVSITKDENGLHDYTILTSGSTRYRIDEWKLDFELPFKWGGIETGLGYIDINNHTTSDNLFGREGLYATSTRTYSQFQYREQTAAAYISAFHQFGSKLSVKAGLRLERTWLKGLQEKTGEEHNDNYTRLYPTLHTSWMIDKNNSLGMKLSMGISRPDFYNLNPFRYYITPTQYYSGNPYLQPSITTNMELNYTATWGLYAVIYESHNHDATCGIPYFIDGVEHSTVYNCMSTDKTGIYASWRHTFFGWWENMIGAELYYQHARAKATYPQMLGYHHWSKKLELEQTFFLNKKKTLQFSLYYTHMFPHYSGLSAVKFKTMAYFDGFLRYRLFHDQLRLSIGFSDPFRQALSRYSEKYSDMTRLQVNDIHMAKFIFNATWSFGGKKVKQVWHQSKATQKTRASK